MLTKLKTSIQFEIDNPCLVGRNLLERDILHSNTFSHYVTIVVYTLISNTLCHYVTIFSTDDYELKNYGFTNNMNVKISISSSVGLFRKISNHG